MDKGRDEAKHPTMMSARDPIPTKLDIPREPPCGNCTIVCSLSLEPSLSRTRSIGAAISTVLLRWLAGGDPQGDRDRPSILARTAITASFAASSTGGAVTRTSEPAVADTVEHCATLAA